MHEVNIKSLCVRVRVNTQDFGRNPLANIVFLLVGAEVGMRRMTLLVLILKQLIYVQDKMPWRRNRMAESWWSTSLIFLKNVRFLCVSKMAFCHANTFCLYINKFNLQIFPSLRHSVSSQLNIAPPAVNICNVVGFIRSAVTTISYLLLNLFSARRTPQSPARILLHNYSTSKATFS